MTVIEDYAEQLVYVAGPFSGPTRVDVDRNILNAVEVGAELAKAGCYPVIPHANSAHPIFEQVRPYDWWLKQTAAMLAPCAAMVCAPGWLNSSGTREEIRQCTKAGRPIFTYVHGQFVPFDQDCYRMALC